jgi:hypothetical protein
MKTLNYLFAAITLAATLLYGQNNTIENYFSKQPSKIGNKNSEPQEYKVILKWQNLDPVNGTKINCNGVKAIYETGLENDFVSWKNVSLAQISDIRENKFDGEILPAFNNFTYKANASDFLKEDFYKTISPEHRDLAKWLVSDAFQMQGLATYVFDSLEFNREYNPKFLENSDIKFEDGITFSSQYQKLIWSGISKYNNEICAIVKFESYNNPVKVDNTKMTFKGRSLYWGEMWISLEDKQVEYATMVEDVVFKLKSSAFPQEQLFDLQKEVTLDKIQKVFDK